MLVPDYQKLQDSLDQAMHSPKGDWYTAPQETYSRRRYRHHVEKRIDFVTTVVKKFTAHSSDAVVGLDLGCGDGSNIPWLSTLVDELHASDYNYLRIRRALCKGGVKSLFLADICSYPVCDATFDLIYMNHVLEHIPDDRTALTEAYRILKPGGLFLLGVPNEGAALWRLAYLLQPGTRARSDHVHFYTENSITTLCRDVGFVVSGVSQMGWGVPHWAADAFLRQWKVVDDVFEWIGRVCCKSQATSLYLMLYK